MKREKLNIIYEDRDLLVVNKPVRLLTIANNNKQEKTLFHQAVLYEKQKNKNNKIFIVHRLDRDVSGLVILAKSEKVKRILQDNWHELVITRGYKAIVEGHVEQASSVIKSYIAETKTFLSYTTNNPNKGKLAITEYKKVRANKKYTLLDINLLTGRKNQIRVHMQDIGHPIAGDKKYGASGNPLNRLGLHAERLEFYHPISKQKLDLISKLPSEFALMFPDT